MSENISSIAIKDKMKDAYLNYSLSVIVGRALPDVRDGLKPVHRIILYASYQLGLTPDKSHKKSARIVGEVLGKFHPHGDRAVYDAMVRMAQDFNQRYRLIDGHGNFGSIDGDSPAAMRYTEARMASITQELLRDINKDTVDFTSNFDDSLEEPEVLPARVPNLLINGSSGIAVGMSTSIPPHNIGEVIEGVIKLIEDPGIDIIDLMKVIKGPDFPTGGIIMGKSSLYDAYKSGRGKIKVRAKTRIEEEKSRIIVDEIPYQVNKSRLIEKIADLVEEDRIEGIRDLRDESGRQGMRIVIELKNSATPRVTLNQLFKLTQLQVTFSVIMLALVDDEPEILNLKEILKHYLEHQKEVVTRRTKYELDRAEARAHILEGYLIALENIDDIVELIKEADDVDTARQKLIKTYNLTEKQANAILRMRLQSLTGLEREKIEEEYEELKGKIEYYKEVLSDEKKLLGIIKEEIQKVKERYSDERRTDIVNQETDLAIEDLIEEEQIVVTLTNQGYIKRMPLDIYSSQHRGGKGIIGIKTKEEDFVKDIYCTSTHHFFLFFTNKGRVYRLKGYQIPEAGRQARGTAIVNLLNLEDNENINAVIPIRKFVTEQYLVMATRRGLIKKTPLKKYESNYTGLIGISLKEGDQLIDVKLTEGEQNIVLTTHEGQAIHFSEKDVRSVGRTAQGVKGIRLSENDYVVGMGISAEGNDLLVVTEKGYGKKTALAEYRLQNRGGKGIITVNTTEKNGKVADIKVVQKEGDLILISENGKVIRTRVAEISRTGRNTMGVKVMDLTEDDQVVSLAKIASEEEVEEKVKEKIEKTEKKS